jgi:YD repeat-containing protein
MRCNVPTDPTSPVPAGEPTPPGGGTAYEYDARGRLVRACDPTGSVTYTAYDGDGRRIGPAAPPGEPPGPGGSGEEPPDEPHIVG